MSEKRISRFTGEPVEYSEETRQLLNERYSEVVQSGFPHDYLEEQTTYVYLFESMGLYKIGLSNDVNRRCKEENKKRKTKVEVAFYAECQTRVIAETIESYLHTYYRKSRFAGDWFTLQPSDFNIVAEICQEKGAIIKHDIVTDCTTDEYLERIISMFDTGHSTAAIKEELIKFSKRLSKQR